MNLEQANLDLNLNLITHCLYDHGRTSETSFFISKIRIPYKVYCRIIDNLLLYYMWYNA